MADNQKENPNNGATRFKSSITSSGMRIVIVVIGRFLSSRFFKTSAFIVFTFLARRFSSGDDPNHVVFTLNVDDVQKILLSVQANHSIPLLIIAACINHHQKRIEESFYGLLKCYAVMIATINPSFLLVPKEGDTIKE